MAPTDVQWTLTDVGGGKATISIVSGTCPAGADGYQAGACVSPCDPTTHIVGNPSCNISLTGTFGLGNTVLAQIRWTLAGVPVSNWSNQKSLALTLDPVVQQYVTDVEALSIGPFDNTTKNALDVFVKGLKSDGVWTKMIEINCVLRISGGANNIGLSMSLLLVGPNGGGRLWTNANFVDADLTANGLIGNAGNKRAATNMIPNLTFPSATNVGLSVYISQVSATASTVEFGAFDTTGTLALLLAANSGGNVAAYCWNSGGDAISAASPNLNGFYSFSRVANNDSRYYFANSTNAFSQIASNLNAITGTTFGTRPLFAWASISAAGSGFAFTDKRVSFMAAHQGLSSAQTQFLFNRVQALRVALGGGFA